MCRLGGVVLSQGTKTEERAIEITENLLMMLVRMEDALGGDGNGITIHYLDGTFDTLKDHREANYFFRHFNTIKDAILNGAHIIQMHSRLSTGGDSKYHENLHPFVHGDIVGSHNGSIEDGFLWDELGTLGVEPYSVVDSEAIIASMSVFASTLHPKTVQTVVSDLHGMFALTLWSKKAPNQMLLVRQDNPLCFWENVEREEIWYASTPSLFPDSINVSTKKVKDTYSYGKNAGKAYMKTVLDVVTLEYGEGAYLRSHKDNTSYEFVVFNMEGTGYTASRYGYGNGEYAYDHYYEDSFWDGLEKYVEYDERY